MSYTDSKQFCAIPWFGAILSHERTLTPCCQFKTIPHENTEYKSKDSLNEYINGIIPVREKMIAGKNVEACRDCYRDEETGVYSLRQAYNDYYRTSNSGDYYIKHLKNFNFLDLEVKITDVCNYACAMCNPRSSTKIYTEWSNSLDNKYIKKFLDRNPDYLENIRKNHTGSNKEKTYETLRNILKDHSLWRLKFTGGEPLLDTELVNILKNIDEIKKSNMHLDIVTNASKDMVQWAKEVGNFKSITMNISLEGIGKVQEYIRKHSVWNEVEKNVLSWKELNLKDSRYNIDTNIVIQGMSIPNLDKLALWTYNNDIPFKYSNLYHTNSGIEKGTYENHHTRLLSKNILNENIISSSIEKLTKVRPEEDWKGILKNKYNKELHKEFLNWIKWYERNSTIKLIDILPELYEI